MSVAGSSLSIFSSSSEEMYWCAGSDLGRPFEIVARGLDLGPRLEDCGGLKAVDAFLFDGADLS